MRGLTAKIKRIVALLRKGHLDVAWKVSRRRLYSDSLFFGLRRDLTVPFTPPNAIFSLTVRRLCDGDIPALLDTAAAGITGEEIDVRLRRLQMLKAYFSLYIRQLLKHQELGTEYAGKIGLGT
jgi:hypothetical protein